MNITDELIEALAKDVTGVYDSLFNKLYLPVDSKTDFGEFKNRLHNCAFLAHLIIDHFIKNGCVNTDKYKSILLGIFNKEADLIVHTYNVQDDDMFDSQDISEDILALSTIVDFHLTKLLKACSAENNIKALKIIDRTLESFNDQIESLLFEINDKIVYDNIYSERYNDYMYELLYSPQTYGVATFYMTYIISIVVDRIKTIMSINNYVGQTELQLLASIENTIKQNMVVAEDLSLGQVVLEGVS